MEATCNDDDGEIDIAKRSLDDEAVESRIASLHYSENHHYITTDTLRMTRFPIIGAVTNLGIISRKTFTENKKKQSEVL